MRLLRIFAQVLFSFFVIVSIAVSINVASQDPGTYSFFDESTGLSIELPKAWERKDPNEAKRALMESNERFWRRPASEGLSKSGIVFIAMASPYTGPEKTRPALSCVASPLPPSMDIKPSDVKLLLETTVDSTFGKYEKNVTISRASKIDISGKEAYRLSIVKANNEPGSFLFVAVLHKKILIQCSGGYDAASEAAVERSLKSIRIK
ncbi:MAG: hypothetical protein AABZ10_16345 [Nitrospirota bacterium]